MMGFNLKDYGGGGLKAPVLEPGAYPARVVGVVLMGMQAQREYQGQPKDPAHEIAITYELLDEFMTGPDGQPDESKPRWFTEFMPLYGLGSERANSTKRYKAIDPEMKYDGDFDKLVNECVMVTITHSPKKDGSGVWENISGVSKMRAKQADAAPELVNASYVFDPDAPDMEVFMRLPAFMREKISKNLQFEGSVLQAALKEAGSDTPSKSETEAAPPKEEDGDDNPY
jgi:hypothetical protein